MQLYFKKLLPHFIVLVLFIITSLIYFNPVLQGKQIFQSDIVQIRDEHADHTFKSGTCVLSGRGQLANVE